MTLEQFYKTTLGSFTKDQRAQAVLKTTDDCFKAFAYLCTKEAEDTFGTDKFVSPVKSLKEMSDFFKLNEKMGDRIDAMTSIRSFAACRMWEEYKTTYLIDPTFYNIFKNTEKLKVFPTELFNVPVPYFAIDLSHCPTQAEGIQVFLANTIGGVTICLNVLYEYTVYQSICTIKYADCTMDRGVLTYDWKKSKLFDKDAVGEADKTLRENTEAIIRDSYNGDADAFLEALGKVDPEKARFIGYMLDDYKTDFTKELEDIKMFIFQFLTYLSCKNPDIKESRDSVKALNRAARMKKESIPPRFFEVGKRFGKRYTLLLDEIKKQKEEVHIDGGSHASPIPHLVTAHWQGYWYGEGKHNYQIKWIACYFKGGIENAADCNEIIHECEENHESIYSHGEKMLYNTLAALKIEYIPQYRINTGRIFDACAILHGKKVMIEIDGEQHFKQVANWDFEATKVSDKEKNEYCRDNNIPLLRIRYDEILNISEIIKDINLKTLKGFSEDYWLSETSPVDYYNADVE